MENKNETANDNLYVDTDTKHRSGTGLEQYPHRLVRGSQNGDRTIPRFILSFTFQCPFLVIFLSRLCSSLSISFSFWFWFVLAFIYWQLCNSSFPIFWYGVHPWAPIWTTAPIISLFSRHVVSLLRRFENRLTQTFARVTDQRINQSKEYYTPRETEANFLLTEICTCTHGSNNGMNRNGTMQYPGSPNGSTGTITEGKMRVRFPSDAPSLAFFSQKTPTTAVGRVGTYVSSEKSLFGPVCQMTIDAVRLC